MSTSIIKLQKYESFARKVRGSYARVVFGGSLNQSPSRPHTFCTPTTPASLSLSPNLTRQERLVSAGTSSSRSHRHPHSFCGAKARVMDVIVAALL